jgi:alpha-tubulin suppressor-like RCC1 family protein
MAVTPGLSFRAMSLTSHSTCALTTDSRLFCWGLNAGGALGVVTTAACASPANLEATCQLLPKRSAGDMRFRYAVLGYDHACAVSDSASVFCWGQNTSGQLGTGTRDSAGPSPVVGDLRYRAITAGQSFTCALASTGDIYCWGLNADGQLGAGSGADAPEPGALASASKFVSLTAGREHACALTSDHEALCWGSNAHGQLGSVVKLRAFTPSSVVFPQTP